MIENKFWLLLTEKQAQEKFLTKEYAINDARELAQKRKKPMYLMECVKIFDVDVNIVETSFEATPEESLEVAPKFKIGDIVNINVIGFKGSQFEITYHTITKEGDFYSVKNIENQDERSQGINECDMTLAKPTESPKHEFKIGDRIEHRNYGLGKILDDKPIYPDIHDYVISFDTFEDDFKVYCAAEHLTLAELTPEPAEPKFEIGDRVLLDNYYECIVDDYFDETKSYKLSLMGGGYNIAKEIRVTKK